MRKRSYTAPAKVHELHLVDLVPEHRAPSQQQLLRLNNGYPDVGPLLYCAGDVRLLKRRAVAVVGSRKPTPRGRKRAEQLVRALVSEEIVVVSGLALGIDTAAHESAIRYGGRTCAVLGVPLDRCTPVSNAALQETIYTQHLLISPFKAGSEVYRSNFPARNKIMAALTDATVIVEASETSGTLHQATECARLGRPLLIPQSLLKEHRAVWPKEFIEASQARVFHSADEVLSAIAIAS